MQLTSDSFSDHATIPGEYAFGVIDPARHVALSLNRNPHLAWRDVPVATRSFALVCHDPDVPSSGDDVNREGRLVAASLPRVDFFHWVLVDLPADSAPIVAGEFSHAVTPRGKGGPKFARKDGTLVRQGINDYTQWFAGDPDMGGDYYGYDGPCPPWNDVLVHRYVFTLFALSVDTLVLPERFTGADVRTAMQGKVLAHASVTGRYTLNPAVVER